MLNILARNNIGKFIRILLKVKLGILLELPRIAFIADTPIEVAVTTPR